MSLTSYRAAPPRVNFVLPPTERAACAARNPVWRAVIEKRRFQRAFCRPGSDLLSRVLRRSTISAGAFHGRVRNGNGCSHPAITTRSAKRTFYREAVLSAPPSRVAMGMSNENDQADRTISTGKLHTLLRFHTRPINVVVFHGSQGMLVSRWVSRLDAFSGYPVRI